MLTAQPSTYDMFALIELYGRKVQSVCKKFVCTFNCINEEEKTPLIVDTYTL